MSRWEIPPEWITGTVDVHHDDDDSNHGVYLHVSLGNVIIKEVQRVYFIFF